MIGQKIKGHQAAVPLFILDSLEYYVGRRKLNIKRAAVTRITKPATINGISPLLAEGLEVLSPSTTKSVL